MSENKNARAELLLPHRRIRLLQNELYVYRELSSTNSVAREMAEDGAPSGTIVTSAFQSAGVGRLRRSWISPPSRSLLMSMILRPRLSARLVPQLTLLCGVVLAETIREEIGCEAGIKWPNDVLMRGKKVSGILAQGKICKDAVAYVVLGLGLNVNQREDELPPDCREISTSLRMESGRRVSRLAALHRFILTWDRHFEAFSRDGYPYLREKWIENNLTLGRDVSVRAPAGPVCGLAVDISERGGLVVRLPDGRTEEFLAEDLSLGRAHYGAE